MIGHFAFSLLSESLSSSDDDVFAGSGTACRFRSFLPVMLSTMPEIEMEGLISAEEPV